VKDKHFKKENGMSENSLQKFSTDTAVIWEDQAAIKQIFAEKLSDTEFKFFVSLGMALGANPFTREIWAVKYGSNPASIFLGRDFYRKKAQEQEDYNGHVCDAVYENDDFGVVNGKVNHSYSLKDRGNLLGAYCVVHRKGVENSFYVYVDLEEYDLKQSLWKAKKSTMIKKVAEAQGLRGAYQGLFKGTYSEVEQPVIEAEQIPATSSKPTVETPQELPEAETPQEDEPDPLKIDRKIQVAIFARLGDRGIGKPKFKKFLKDELKIDTSNDILIADLDLINQFIVDNATKEPGA
jgi:phage recombination protein Bet